MCYIGLFVIFSEIYWPIFPGVAWFWNDWSRVNECSMQAASPLYQSFNLFLRAQWLTKYGPKSLTPPPKDKVQVVIEVRAINPNKQNSHSSARHIRNLDVLVKALETLPNVAVIAADFATMPFPEQVKLSHSASIFISMHGAGTTHIFHSALGSPNCCALVELFPDTSVSLYSAQGYGNLARMFGMHHHRHVSKDGSTSPQGTTLDVAEVRRLVEAASKEVTRTPTCLHDVRDPAHVNTMGLPEFFSYSR